MKKIAQEICKSNNTIIEFKKSNDPRSYRMNSDKIIKKGFINQHNNLSLFFHLYSEFIHVLHHVFTGIKKPHKIFWALGILSGVLLSLILLKQGQSIIKLIEEYT